MSNSVYANGREVSCKAANGKSICCFPDVCFTPPENPATPPGVPIPYPNTGMASDTTSGTKSVKVTNKEVMLKNKSYFKKSYGDEAGCATKKGVVTSVNRGKVYFISWSMDVKFEGENVVRHLDLTTHNHNPAIGNTAPWTYADRMAMADGIEECDSAKGEVKSKCGDDNEKAKCPSSQGIKDAETARANAKAAAGDAFKTDSAYLKANDLVKSEYEKFATEIEKDECHKALRCFLTPYSPSRCCNKQTPHHVVDAASFLDPIEGVGRDDPSRRKAGWKKYVPKKAPCVCCEGPNQSTATHGEIHARTSVKAEASMDANGQWTRAQATKAGVKSVNETFPNTKACDKCLEKQLDKYHDAAKTTADDSPLDATTEGSQELIEKFRKPTTNSSR